MEMIREVEALSCMFAQMAVPQSPMTGMSPASPGAGLERHSEGLLPGEEYKQRRKKLPPVPQFYGTPAKRKRRRINIVGVVERPSLDSCIGMQVPFAQMPCNAALITSDTLLTTCPETLSPRSCNGDPQSSDTECSD